ncbi:MAG: three-Cys-motif partner protein TcmP [Phycisphaerae bacterium]|nr:three-Cys-motif partner protein TcmP [Phycisphaerae bacterium]
MNKDSGDLYVNREQTLVKHVILKGYLERFAHIIGSAWDTITYVDGFSGPWNSRSDTLEDSSFSIALAELRKARDTLAQRGKKVHIRCLFLEKAKEAYQRLRAFAEGVRDAEVVTLNADFEESISQIVAFVQSGGVRSFPFVFVDPTGWTGFAMDRIGPLLRLRPGEVLINFMTGHILRFIESPQGQTQESFEALFATDAYRNRIAGLKGQDREDTVVRAYMDAVQCEGDFRHVCPAIVLRSEKDRTHFHLIYATRSLRGVEVFKAAEKTAMKVMEQARAKAQQRSRVQKSGQQELFRSEDMHDPSYYEGLRNRYLTQACHLIEDVFRQSPRALYDTLWSQVMALPLVWESDLKKWIGDWQKSGAVEIEGLEPPEKTPKRDSKHWLIWRGQ